MVDIRKRVNHGYGGHLVQKKYSWKASNLENKTFRKSWYSTCFEIGIAELWYWCGGITAWHDMGSHRGLCNQ